MESNSSQGTLKVKVAMVIDAAKWRRPLPNSPTPVLKADEGDLPIALTQHPAVFHLHIRLTPPAENMGD